MPETYKTAAGSEVTIIGKHRGSWSASFDWFEEGAPHPGCALDVDTLDPSDAWLLWQCECCEAGQARLFRCDAGAPDA